MKKKKKKIKKLKDSSKNVIIEPQQDYVKQMQAIDLEPL